MDFLLKINYSILDNNSLRNLQESIDPLLIITNRKAAFKVCKYNVDDVLYIVFGDLIFPKYLDRNNAKAEYLQSNHSNKSLSKLKGFYYVIVFNYKDNKIEIHSSFLNVLPVYYYQCNKDIIVSGSMFEILQHVEQEPIIEPLYVIEKSLFNYAFLNNTPFRNIFLLPSCSYLEISNIGIKICSHYSLDEFIYENPIPWKSNLHSLSDLYCREIISYIPEYPFAITLTGGFDSRTILSTALKMKCDIHAFSYGSVTDSDITIPRSIAKNIGFDYTAFLLDENYASNHFWNDGLAFLVRSEGCGNISRAHYVLTATEISKKYNYLMTGNFGSELIRSLKDPGVMASNAIFKLFEYENRRDFEDYIINSRSLKLLNSEILKANLQVVIENAWNYKKSLPSIFTKNQKLYMYVFAEIFRKYFGSELVMQSDFLINRSPFIDYNIFKSTLEHSIAGVYQNFMEKNPIKRFHGQILYVHILRKMYPALLNIGLDRNYKPKDFLTTLGKMQIIRGYIKKNKEYKKDKRIPSYSQKLYEMSSFEIFNLIDKSKYLQKQLVTDMFLKGKWKAMQHEYFNALSMEITIKNNFEINHGVDL